MRREGVCIHCGKKVIADDEAQTFGHDEPVCEQFAALHANSDETRSVSNEAVGAHLDALARRVEGQKAR